MKKKHVITEQLTLTGHCTVQIALPKVTLNSFNHMQTPRKQSIT
jgi:hypothetical protein